MNFSAIKYLLLLCLTCFILLVTVVVEYVQQQLNDNIDTEAHLAAQQQLQLVRYHLESLLSLKVIEAGSLATFISVSPDSTEPQWRQIAEKMTADSRYIRNITVAPNDVIRFVHPLASNAAVIGLDYRSLPNQWQGVERARLTQTMQIIGPLTLIQGGEGLILRLPVFADPPHNLVYWGGCSVVFDWPNMLADSGITALAQQYSLALRRVDDRGNPSDYFWGDGTAFDEPLALEVINFFSGHWQLAMGAAKQPPLQKRGQQLVRLFGYSLIALTVVSALLLYQYFNSVHRYSYEDVLTKVGNRRQAMMALRQLAASRGRFGIISVDLNDFKKINDNFGHAAGDLFLQQVAQRLKQQLRGTDLVTRLGGDEFLLIISRLKDSEDLQRVQEKIRQYACQTPVMWQQHPLNVSLAMGSARYPTDASSINQLLQFADSAMYQDKQRVKQAASPAQS
ncbi:sensor domain-containing diguanylate cyclase [Shewanella avicenniae]|uniref:Sensor domain-containing diguanylate cyclase n=1 Tax=Shewanella avicenniae TaxID=2814294 RepID=A0ABX7QT95_9GAMM|nr:diguanylate cyclase [Shewanella avicenniae]QSX33908.1 sensor domain-containing diguanylate cyclase [Shewanella avicenniae]